ncbi:MAG: transcriptional repressor NrdR [Schwartzia sp.]|jgi:transcriptional repressor NrdR|nr:transcriptional repressor NrdR [Schwartzia sp. (in: firmicutes)]MBP3690066.1 transcriptional repressor NrdR [Schwartzia sp. (in: firmicutes)]
MRCPYCKQLDSRVIDSRGADDGNSIRRRRECTACGRRFTTYEVVEKMPLIVIKNDGRRVVFDHDKLLNGLIRSCDKRNIPTEQIVSLADEIERELRNTMDREVTTKAIGELVMEKLRNFDEVAYIRFASVYRKFADISMFKEELEELLRARTEKNS